MINGLDKDGQGPLKARLVSQAPAAVPAPTKTGKDGAPGGAVVPANDPKRINLPQLLLFGLFALLGGAGSAWLLRAAP